MERFSGRIISSALTLLRAKREAELADNTPLGASGIQYLVWKQGVDELGR